MTACRDDVIQRVRLCRLCEGAMADHTHGRKDLQANACQGNILISMQLPWKPHFIRCDIFVNSAKVRLVAEYPPDAT